MGVKMPKPKAMIDYLKCHPERCDTGICVATLKCPVRVLRQDAPQEVPYVLQDFCVGCGKCAAACPFKAIKMM
ncbi:hypothetical protein DRI96_06460 [Candidatus Aerophobetes bacterium]|uniref:4Fe-4S ferredoxin-type domain-containing protein n=1 Tax=Aerophobetes bacterium TaxID=2030807 RepID=A0A662DAY9_UNCAE|nr:MAG: hypothetical protein DRI96_06460 [Candidatus Aerophobetes bacterium]